jgi:NAD(P)H-quinone oxidoreductase subunit 5
MAVSWVRAMPLNLLMLVLVLFLGYIVIAYSKRYMHGEEGQARYLLWLQFLLAAVVVVVTTDHLLIFVAAWVCISLTLHQLLMFYPERPRAALAAHKKFLLARLAESMLLGASILLYSHHETWRLSEILATAGQRPLALTEQVAMLLIAVTAMIKCAQLPVHGWLIQVVEAPTPISALLHAGVINLGGFLLLLYAPLFSQATAAQWLVLLIAGPSTVLAALVMTTRVSVKVRLAWSTSAQMGLMLIECALGLYELALLHLIAHSTYKAYAFLNSGSAVTEHLRIRMVRQSSPGKAVWLLSLLISAALVSLWVFLSGYSGVFSPWVLLTLGLAFGMATSTGASGAGRWKPVVGSIFLAVLLIACYDLLKTLAGLALYYPAPVISDAGIWADIWVTVLFVALALAAWVLRYRADARPVQQFSVLLFAGFYADEWFTRTTLQLWPTRLPMRPGLKSIDRIAALPHTNKSVHRSQEQAA